MSGAIWAGKLFGQLLRLRIGGKSDLKPDMTSWKMCSGCSRSFRRCLPKSRNVISPGTRLPVRIFVAASSERSGTPGTRSEEHTSELQSHSDLVCRLLLEKKKK